MCASASATSRSIAAGSSDAPTDFTTRYVPRVFEITCTDTVPLLFFFLRTNMGAFYPSGHPLLNLGYVVKPRNSDLRGRDENRKKVTSITATTDRGLCIFSGTSTVSRSFVTVRGLRSMSVPSNFFVRLPRTNSSHRAPACLLVRRIPDDDLPQAVHKYRITPPREPFLMTFRRAHHSHFFSHILPMFLKYH